MSELGSVADDVATISGMRTPLAPRRWSIEDYHRMAAAGILGEDDRVELLEGEIVEMSPIGSVHAAAVRALARHIQRAAGDRCLVSVQGPIRLPPPRSLSRTLPCSASAMTSTVRSCRAPWTC